MKFPLVSGRDMDVIPSYAPISNLIGLRCSFAAVHLIVHDIIVEQVNLHRTGLTDETIPTSNMQRQTRQADLAAAETLLRQSTDKVLSNCRVVARMVQALVSTGLLQTGSLAMRSLIRIVPILAQTPCNEQGYPTSTEGGYNWTWAQKEEEVKWCLTGLRQMSWAWSDVEGAVLRVEASLERMRPWPGQMQGQPSKPSEEFVETRRQEMAGEIDTLHKLIQHPCPRSP